jgi:hypothetical protein
MAGRAGVSCRRMMVAPPRRPPPGSGSARAERRVGAPDASAHAIGPYCGSCSPWPTLAPLPVVSIDSADGAMVLQFADRRLDGRCGSATDDEGVTRSHDPFADRLGPLVEGWVTGALWPGEDALVKLRTQSNLICRADRCMSASYVGPARRADVRRPPGRGAASVNPPWPALATWWW